MPYLRRQLLILFNFLIISGKTKRTAHQNKENSIEFPNNSELKEDGRSR
jgi:hypothetical protein